MLRIVPFITALVLVSFPIRADALDNLVKQCFDGRYEQNYNIDDCLSALESDWLVGEEREDVVFVTSYSLFGLGRYRDALDVLDAHVERFGENEGTLLYRTQFTPFLEDPDAIMTVIDQAEAAGLQNEPETIFAKGYLDLLQGNPRQAADLFMKATETAAALDLLEPIFPIYAGKAFVEAGDRRAAADAFAKAEEVYDKFAPDSMHRRMMDRWRMANYVAMIEEHNQAGAYEAVVETANEALDAMRGNYHYDAKWPYRGRLNLELGAAYLALKQYGRAKGPLRDAEKYEAEDAGYAVNLYAWAVLNDEDLDDDDVAEALDAAEDSIAMTEAPDGMMFDTLGVAYLEAGRAEEAVESFMKGMRTDPSYAKALHERLADLGYYNGPASREPTAETHAALERLAAAGTWPFPD